MQGVQAIHIQSQQRQKKLTSAVIYHVAVGVVCLLMLYPLFWLLSSSMKAPSEVWTTVNSLMPKEFHLENYSNGWAGFGGITFTTFFTNSFIYAGFGTLFTVASSAMIAYGFGRLKFRF